MKNLAPMGHIKGNKSGNIIKRFVWIDCRTGPTKAERGDKNGEKHKIESCGKP